MLRAVTAYANAPIQVLPQATLELHIERLRKWPRLPLLARVGCVAAALGLSGVSAFAGCNSGNLGKTNLLSSPDCQAETGGSTDDTAVGYFAKATGTISTAFGASAFARGTHSTALGAYAGSDLAVAGATAVGAFAAYPVAGKFSTAVGAGVTGSASRAAGDYSIAIGGGDNAPFFNKFLVGARASRFQGIAIGTTSRADSDFAIALGFNARAGAGADIIGPIAIGPDALATLTNAVALGRFSAATADNSTALGSESKVSAVGSLALGFRAKATKRLAVAIGSRSVANVANTVSVGRAGAERRIMNVAPGLLNTDAVNLAQVKALIGSAVAQASTTAPAVSVVSAGSRPAAIGTDDAVRRELAELRAMVRQQQILLEQQQQRIARLEGQSTER